MRHYYISSFAEGAPSALSRTYARRRTAEREARAMPGHVEVWCAWWTRVGRTITGTAHRRVLVVLDGIATARARLARVGTEEAP